MSIVEITSSQTLGWESVAMALTAEGIVSQLVNAHPLRITLEGMGSDSPVQRVAQALEAWLAKRGSPLLAEVVNDGLVVLRPPAA